jgi:hypothetical protein
MADSQKVELPVAVTQAKRNSYLRHVQIHMELLENSLAGDHTGCALGEGDREEIEKHLLGIWNIAWGAQLAVAVRRPAPSGDGPTAAPGSQGGKVIPLRPRRTG